MAGTSNLEKIYEMLAEQSGQHGQHVANLSNLGRNFDRHCVEDDERHKENVAEMRATRVAIETLTAVVKPLADTVAVMKPVVDGYQVTRWKLAGGLAVISVVIGAGGWFIATVITEAVKVVFRKIGLSV